jgi:hypothetical protein
LKRKIIFAVGPALGLLFLIAGLAVAADLADLEINPSYLDITCFYSGQKIKISGTVPADRDIIIEIKGPERKDTFNMKGRIGPFWMNRDKVELEHVPFLYALLLPGNRKWDSQLDALGVGMHNLEKNITIRPKTLSFDTIFEQFIQLKRSQRLYAKLDDAISYSPESKGRKHLTASFTFPPSIVPAEYKVVTTLISNGKADEKSVFNFTVKEVGLTKTIRELAHQRGLIYGLLSVAMALISGAIIGIIFIGGDTH